MLYVNGFEVLAPSKLKVVAKDTVSGKFSEVLEVDLPLAKKDWKVINGEKDFENLIDDNPSTNYVSEQNMATIDLGNSYNVTGFTYYPMQNRYMSGVIETYSFYTSQDGKNWQKAAQGEFGNIANSPVEQRIEFESVNARFIQLKALNTIDDKAASFAEIGVLLK
jgi:alpha-L-fucosidase